VVCAASITHVYGHGSGCLPYLFAGATVILVNSFCTYSGLLEWLLKPNTTIFIGLPIHYELLCSKENIDISNVRLALSAGGILSTHIFKNAVEKIGIPINNMYGMSELGAIATVRGSTLYSDPSVVGIPMNNVLINHNINFKKPNNVLVKSNALAYGYYNFDTRKINRMPLDEEGWFNTGDIGFFLSDGSLTLCGRADEMINVMGNKVNPRDIEKVIEICFGVKEVAVAGRIDESRGQVPIAYVIAKEISKEAIMDACYKLLPLHKVPREIIFVEHIPRTPNGKIMKNKL